LSFLLTLTESTFSNFIEDWEEDHGSLADDENDSDCSSIQLESDDDRELSGYTATCFQVIPSASLTGFSKKGNVVLKK
jgi:hypothetical protein